MARINPPSGNLEKLKLNLLGEAKRKHFIKPAPALVKLHWYKPEKTGVRRQKSGVAGVQELQNAKLFPRRSKKQKL